MRSQLRRFQIWVINGVRHRSLIPIFLGSLFSATGTLSLLLVLEEIDVNAGRITRRQYWKRQILWTLIYLVGQFAVEIWILKTASQAMGFSMPGWLIVIIVLIPVLIIKARHRFKR